MMRRVLEFYYRKVHHVVYGVTFFHHHIERKILINKSVKFRKFLGRKKFQPVHSGIARGEKNNIRLLLLVQFFFSLQKAARKSYFWIRKYKNNSVHEEKEENLKFKKILLFL